MHLRVLLSTVAVCGVVAVSAVPAFAQRGGRSGGSNGQRTGASAADQGNDLLAEIRGLVSDVTSRAATAEGAQPPQVNVATCLNQVVQTLTQYESSATAALNSLNTAVGAGDSATAQAQLSVMILANKNAKVAAGTAEACEASAVTGAAGDSERDEDDRGGDNSRGGMSGLDELEGDDDVAVGFGDEDGFVPDGDDVEDPATSDVVSNPAVTP